MILGIAVLGFSKVICCTRLTGSVELIVDLLSVEVSEGFDFVQVSFMLTNPSVKPELAMIRDTFIFSF